MYFSDLVAFGRLSLITCNIFSYELTPVPDSSTYNFSDDDDDEKSSNKRIPLWAQGKYFNLYKFKGFSFENSSHSNLSVFCTFCCHCPVSINSEVTLIFFQGNLLASNIFSTLHSDWKMTYVRKHNELVIN